MIPFAITGIQMNVDALHSNVAGMLERLARLIHRTGFIGVANVA